MRIKQWVSFPLNAKRLIFQSVDKKSEFNCQENHNTFFLVLLTGHKILDNKCDIYLII